MNNIFYERWREFFARAEAGGELTIGFFGGSITQGSLASAPELCYAFRVYHRLCSRYPQTTFHYVNGGIGGTTSHFGVARVNEDLLCYRPDMVVVDFSVNDEPDGHFRETYEGLIRRIVYSDSAPAVLLLHNVYYDSGKTAEDIHREIGGHYGLPSVSIRDTVYKRMTEGEYSLPQLTPDGLHPNDYGHELVAAEIVRVLDEIKSIAKSKAGGADGDFDCTFEKLPPLTQNRYEDAIRYTIANFSPKLYGFRADSEEKLGHLDFFKNGWIGKRVGDRIVFYLENISHIAVQYRKTIHRPAPVARAVLDGDEARAVMLDGNFGEEWGDCLYLEPLEVTAKGEHTLEIEIIEAAENCASDFYLLSVICA